jgi:hypothetical protein
MMRQLLRLLDPDCAISSSISESNSDSESESENICI